MFVLFPEAEGQASKFGDLTHVFYGGLVPGSIKDLETQSFASAAFLFMGQRRTLAMYVS